MLYASLDVDQSWQRVSEPLDSVAVTQIAAIGPHVFAATFGLGVVRMMRDPDDRRSLPPDTTTLQHNYPNPVHPETWMPFALHEGTDVEIVVYDMAGSVVRTLGLGHREAGYYTSHEKAAYWDGRNDDGELGASGTYFYTLFAGESSETGRMVVSR